MLPICMPEQVKLAYLSRFALSRSLSGKLIADFEVQSGIGLIHELV